jgi:hypothetical protein
LNCRFELTKIDSRNFGQKCFCWNFSGQKFIGRNFFGRNEKKYKNRPSGIIKCIILTIESTKQALMWFWRGRVLLTSWFSVDIFSLAVFSKGWCNIN